MRSGAMLTNWRFLWNAYAATEAGRAIGQCFCEYPELIVKGKRISCPPQYGHRDPQGVLRRLGGNHGFEHGFPLIRSLRASAQRSTSVLFSFVLSLLIVAGSFAIRQSKTGAHPLCEARRAVS
jgi:hypothetical protein